jgi:hypothetical protein
MEEGKKPQLEMLNPKMPGVAYPTLTDVTPGKIDLKTPEEKTLETKTTATPQPKTDTEKAEIERENRRAEREQQTRERLMQATEAIKKLSGIETQKTPTEIETEKAETIRKLLEKIENCKRIIEENEREIKSNEAQKEKLLKRLAELEAEPEVDIWEKVYGKHKGRTKEPEAVTPQVSSAPKETEAGINKKILELEVEIHTLSDKRYAKFKEFIKSGLWDTLKGKTRKLENEKEALHKAWTEKIEERNLLYQRLGTMRKAKREQQKY